MDTCFYWLVKVPGKKDSWSLLLLLFLRVLPIFLLPIKVQYANWCKWRFILFYLFYLEPCPGLVDYVMIWAKEISFMITAELPVSFWFWFQMSEINFVVINWWFSILFRFFLYRSSSDSNTSVLIFNLSLFVL